MAIRLAKTDEAGAVVLRVEGEVDLESSPTLWSELRGLLGRGGAVVVDLSAVDYIDSSGVAVLIQGLKHAGRTKVDFRLRRPSGRVTAVLELAQLTRLFEIELE